MKKIEIEIPKGKKAEWVDGVLTLVDEKPQDITERIKTFEDACEALGDEHPLVKEYWGVINVNLDIAKDLIAYLKLRIITAALNEGWDPTFDAGEGRYYACFYLYTDAELAEKSNEWKLSHTILSLNKRRVPLRSNNSANAVDDLVYAFANYAELVSYARYGERLALRTRELADYCGMKFIDIWADFLIK